MTAKEQTHSKTRAQVSQKSETVSPKAKPRVQKDRQEAKQRKDKTFKEDWEKRQKETQEYMYSQSSKFSSVSRSLIFGIIGTIWVITYSDGHMRIPNWALLFSLLAGLLFLFSDVIHYYSDSVSYEDEQNRFDNYKTPEDLDNKHEPEMDRINKRSHIFINIKFVILIICSILFIVGLCI